MNRSALSALVTAAMVAFLGTNSAHAADAVATVDKKATLPVVVAQPTTERSGANVLVVETAGVEGNTNKVPLSGAVALKVNSGDTEQRIDLGHFFLFGSQPGTPESYAFNLDSNPQVTGPVLQALKAGKAEAEVTITPADQDKGKAASVRLPINASYVELPSK